MFKLIRLTFILILIVTAVLAIARTVGQSKPSELPLAMIFTKLDGSPCETPCLFGVRPGSVTIEEARRLLLASPHIRTVSPPSGGNLLGIFALDGHPGNFSMNQNFADVYLSTDAAYSHVQSLGEALTALGVPSYVFVGGDGITLQMWFSTKNTLIRLEPLFGGRLTLNTRVTGFEFYTGMTAEIAGFRKMSWQGFTYVSRYGTPGSQ